MPTILLTDDQVSCSEIEWHTLRCLGCEMIYVQEKPEALARLPEIRPDLVITDLFAPGLNGFEFIRQVKALDEKLPVILLSGNLDDDKRQRAMRLGACQCIDKPFTVEGLREAVRRALGDRGG